MVRVDQSVTIDRPSDVVFKYIQDIERQPEWASALQESSKMSSGPTGKGTTYRSVAKTLGRRLELVCEVSAYEPPRVYEFQTHNGPMHMLMRYTLTPEGNRTRVDHMVEGESGGIFKLADSIAARVLKKQFETDLESLKTLLESGWDAEPGSVESDSV
ncbi:MAG: SRPBCC family protein [Chloroflexota bacterium]